MGGVESDKRARTETIQKILHATNWVKDRTVLSRHGIVITGSLLEGVVTLNMYPRPADRFLAAFINLPDHGPAEIDIHNPNDKLSELSLDSKLIMSANLLRVVVSSKANNLEKPVLKFNGVGSYDIEFINSFVNVLQNPTNQFFKMLKAYQEEHGAWFNKEEARKNFKAFDEFQSNFNQR